MRLIGTQVRLTELPVSHWRSMSEEAGGLTKRNTRMRSSTRARYPANA